MKKSYLRMISASTCLTAAAVLSSAAWAASAAVPTVADGIGGVVTSSKGPEAGVWVIAETRDLPQRFIKIVVTDDQGRYLLPELPKASYDIWVRGYGLVESAKTKAQPGKNIDLKADIAPDLKAASKYFPANYWFALITPPPDSAFPGTGPKGNGIPPAMKTQQQWLSQVKNCIVCHQMGDPLTRTLLDNTAEGWAERITKARGPQDQAIGDHGKDFADLMGNMMTQLGRQRSLPVLADWTQGIEKGALPRETPPRPQGVERNLVLTSWDWANGRYIHDNVVSDRHNPRMNPNGPVWGIAGMWGYINSLDPVTGQEEEIGYKVTPNVKVELLPPDQPPDAFPHNPMLDSKGRVWITDKGRFGAPKPGAAPPPDKMPYCTDASFKFAKYWPIPGKTTETAVVYDPKDRSVDGIPMCSGIHHLQFNVDQKTLYFSGDTAVVSWVDTAVWDSTKDAAKSVGWCPMVLDTNSTTPSKRPAPGDVTITPDRAQWNDGGITGREPDVMSPRVIDATKDTRTAGFLYGIDADVSDGSMWGARTGPFPSGLVKFHPGSSPPETCHTEYFEPPKAPDGKYAAFLCRGVSVDSKGVAYGACGSGAIARFERSKCKVISGPTIANGQHCPEGWSIHDFPRPKIYGVKDSQGVTAEFTYLNWVDIHDTLGLGKDTALFAGSNSDSIVAFDDRTKKTTTLRVPYPMGFHTRGMDGRIDDPAKGWKGKGLWATYATGPVWHQEGADDGVSGPTIVKFQFRPDPLAH